MTITNPTIYNFPDGYPHGMKKEDFVKMLVNDFIYGDSNLDDIIWQEYDNLGGDTDYDTDLYSRAEVSVIQRYTHDITEWKNDYWTRYVMDYEYPYFIGEDE